METKITPPLVSVLVATYNQAGKLRLALESVRWQTLQDFEVWVIGDGCTDDSAQVVESFHDARLHWLNLPENSGYASAPHNEGLRRARGRYIAYLNHDDLWLPAHLALLTQALETGGADLAYSIVEQVRPGDQNRAILPVDPAAGGPPEASASLHRRSLVDELGYWKLPGETRSIPRVEYFRRAQLAGRQFVLVPALTVLMFDRRAYDAAIPQAEYAARLTSDPHFAEQELARLLVQAEAELEGPLTFKRLRVQLANALCASLVRRKIDPGRLGFWQRRGRKIRAWRRYHGLE